MDHPNNYRIIVEECEITISYDNIVSYSKDTANSNGMEEGSNQDRDRSDNNHHRDHSIFR